MVSVTKFIETDVDIEINLVDFDDDDLVEELRKRKIEYRELDDIFDFMVHRFWTIEEWKDLQLCISNLIKPAGIK